MEIKKNIIQILFNYGVLGLWTIYLLIENNIYLKQMKEMLKILKDRIKKND